MKRIYMFIMTILCSIGIAVAISYAWFLNDANVDPIAQGMSGSAYFAYGNGAIADDDHPNNRPYGINQPRHLYNLAWLVYLFPETYANLKYEIDPNLEGTLDMEDWVLPPIGTDINPFTGYFNGNGKTIENLTTSNNVSNMSTKPNNISNKVTNNVLNDCSSIGLFGAIAKASSETDAKVYNFYLQGSSVETAQSATCIGIVAGYVDAKIENVGVVNSGINLGNSSHSTVSGRTNLSDYTVVGYATEDYTTTVANSKTVVYNATTTYDHFNYRGMGGATAWGGSINMTELYNRIVNLRPYRTTSISNSVSTYPTSRLCYVNCRNDSITTVSNSSNLSNGSSTYVVRTMGGANGTYLKRNDSDTYNYLSSLYADTLIVTKLESTESGETIRSSDGYYLNISSQQVANTLNFNTSITSDTECTTYWREESNSPNVNLYAYNADDGYKYYLSVDSNRNLVLLNEDQFDGTSWSWDANLTTYKYTDANNHAYYLKYVNHNWTIIPTFAITDGTNYLVNNNGTISNATVSSNATLWYFSNNGSSSYGVLTDVSNSQMKLTINGTALVANNSGTSWSYDGTNLFSGNKVVKFNGTTWIVETQNTYLIQYNGHYLTYNLSDTTNRANATQWTLGNTLSNLNGNGTISYNDGTNTYYLRYNAGLTTTNNANQATTWYHDQYGIYHNDNGTRYYIQYDTTWKAAICSQKVESGYYISYNGNNYLTADLSNTHKITNKTNTTEATLWKFSNTGTYPSGTISTVIDGVTWYVVASANGYVEMDTTPHTFTNNRNQIADTTTNYGLDGYRSNYWHSYSSNNLYTMTVTSASKSYDDPDNTQFAQIGVYTNYISRCDEKNNVTVFVNTTNIYLDTYSRILKKEPSLFTYIPLLVDDNKNVKSTNTGYIISGGHSGGTSLTGQDIRVSKYALTDIGNSYSNGSITTIYTCGYDSNGNRKIAQIGSSDFPVESFSKYTSSLSDFDSIIDKDSSYVYGLHFMDASISKNNLVRLPNATISDDTSLTNYQMPEDCIDFKLKQKGLINFYAGYYFRGTSGSTTIYNDSFFSLHEIIRDNKNYITAINHIDKIYGKYKTVNGTKKIDLNVDFVYKYVSASEITGKLYSNNSNSAPAGYDVLFDRDWIENGDTGSTYRKNIFYFEIPVNEGEFALGSVSGKNGAYLMYLDIGANAAIVDRTQITQETVNTISNYVYVNGIQILSTNSGQINANNSYVAIIPAGTYNSITVGATSITGSSLNMSYNGTGQTITNGILVPRKIDGTTHLMTDVGTVQSKTTKVLKYYDYNNGRDRLYEVTVSQVDSNAPSYSVYCIFEENAVVNRLINDTTSTEAEYGLLVKGTGTDANYGVAPSNITSLISNASFRTSDTDIILEYDYQILANYHSITEVYVMNHTEITPENTTSPSSSLNTYKINGKTISGTTNRLEDGDYYLQHVYRMIGNTITVSIEAPNSGITTDYDVTIKINVYEPNRLEATGDTSPGYTFVINDTTIQSTSTTVTVTADAYSGA